MTRTDTLRNIDDYYHMSRQAALDMPGNLSKFFSERCTGLPLAPEIQSLMANFIERAKQGEYFRMTEDVLTFENFLWFILVQEGNLTVPISSTIKKYAENRRQRKKYLFTNIDKEYRNEMADGILHKNCREYFALMAISADDMKQYASETEYIDKHYAQVLAWKKNADSDLIDYPYILSLPPKKIATSFLNDVTYHLYDLIQSKYFGNAVDGMVSQIPRIFAEGIFAIRPGTQELKHEVSADKIVSYTENEIDSIGTMRVVMGQVFGNYIDAIQNEQQEALVDQMIRDGSLTLQGSVLDAYDETLYQYIFDRFSVQDLPKDYKRIQVLELVKHFFKGKPRKEQYIFIMEHLYRLSTSHVEISVKNASGKSSSGGVLTFFEFAFNSNAENEDEAAGGHHAEVRVSDTFDPAAFIGSLDSNHLSDLTVDIFPSTSMKSSIKNKMIMSATENIKFLTRELAEIDNPKTKSLLFLLQKERLDMYPKVDATYDVSYFEQRLQLDNMKRSMKIKFLRDLFDQLKSKGIVIRDYKMDQFKIEMNYKPVTDDELSMFRIGAAD